MGHQQLEWQVASSLASLSIYRRPNVAVGLFPGVYSLSHWVAAVTCEPAEVTENQWKHLLHEYRFPVARDAVHIDHLGFALLKEVRPGKKWTNDSNNPG